MCQGEKLKLKVSYFSKHLFNTNLTCKHMPGKKVLK